MKRLSVIIPSKLASNLIPCARAVRTHEPDVRIIVVDDGLDDDSLYFAELDRLRSEGVEFIFGEKPFIFSRNCNAGFVLAGTDDIVILNDDAVLQTPGGFSRLQQAAADHPQFGIISSTTNVAGNPEQYPQPHHVGLREAARSIAFVCVLVPRCTIDAIGLMDERFGGLTADGRRIYGYCDNDYSRRVRNAGLKVGIHDGCFVDHGSLQSTFRGDPRASGDTSASRELYLAKWGDLN